MVAVILYYSHYSLSLIDNPSRNSKLCRAHAIQGYAGGRHIDACFFCLWYMCYHFLYKNQVRALCNPMHKENSIMVWALAFQKKGIDRGGVGHV
jgi:hypothetical protein